MNYYKVKLGYDRDAFISIDSTQLQSAYIAFITEQKAILGGRAIRGKDIISIEPDIHRNMGWNQGYVLGAEDWSIWNNSQKILTSRTEVEQASIKANEAVTIQSKNNNLLE